MHDPALPPPMREGILQLQPPRLLGSQCPACGMRTFPARGFCPACDTDAAPVGVVLAPAGRVFSYTVVRQAPGGRPVPYALAYIDLDDGVRVLAQLDHPPEEIVIGLRVCLTLRNVVPAPGEPRLGYAFTATPAFPARHCVTRSAPSTSSGRTVSGPGGNERQAA